MHWLNYSFNRNKSQQNVAQNILNVRPESVRFIHSARYSLHSHLYRFSAFQAFRLGAVIL